MSGLMRFTCSCCGEIHEGSPGFAFDAPSPYLEQDEQTRRLGSLDSEHCRYEDADGPHYFIRTTLDVPILGIEEPFCWGVWVSVSQKSFEEYVAGAERTEPRGGYFGWLCNYLPYYSSTYALAMNVLPRSDGLRAELVPHESEHELVRDYHAGITPEKAQRIAEICLHGSGNAGRV